jgi:hypothetical protein
MTRVIANLSMSIDGFIADPDDGCADLFGWYSDGAVPVHTHSGHVFHVTEASAAVLREASPKSARSWSAAGCKRPRYRVPHG